MRQISLQGHRGARGLLAENTLPSLLKPFEYGMDGIEFDVQLSRDNQVVIHHDYCLNPAITRDAASRWIKKPSPVIRALTLKQLKQYRLGKPNMASVYGLRFRKQQPMDDQQIPTLPELVEALDKQGLNKVLLNLEIKHSPLHAEWCPRPSTLARHVVEQIHALDISSRCIVQCFNWAVIKAVQEIDASLPISCLTMADPLEDTVSAIGGRPSAWTAGLDVRDFGGSAARMAAAFGADYWSGYFRNQTRQEVDIAHQHELKVMAWTVNHAATMKRFFDWGLDGIITDYPDKLEQVWSQWSYKNRK